MAPRQTRYGYTLIELMIVVTIIGVSITAAVPAMSRAMADSRVGEAARELVRMGRRARSETAAYLRAHLVWIQPVAEGGVISLIRGTTNSCLSDNWDALYQADLCGNADAACLERLDFSSEAYRGVYLTELMFEPSGGGAVVPTATAICYAPNGVVWHAQPGSMATMTLLETNTNANARGGYRFVVRMMDGDGNVRGMVRRALFPLGAAPRSL
jgi:prepilin-type N-terminal cleavage/methylation domain-containing protein